MHFRSIEPCIDAILSRTGKRIVLGIPLGIGKPNALVNGLYARAKRDPTLSLEIITALSLNPPLGKSELEERFLRPIRERVWGDYPRLSFVDDRDAQCLPDNVRVHEFYMRSGSQLHNAYAQRHYISSNYTHVARDMLSRGVNLVMQAVAVRAEPDGRKRYSLSSNPDVTLQLFELLKQQPQPCLRVAQVNALLPWFGRDAEVDESQVDLLVDAPELYHRPFSVPHEPVDSAAWAIGLYGSALVKDGGTLQVGIGALGDAVCHALRLREQNNQAYRRLLRGLGESEVGPHVGGQELFALGLYVASELISNPLFSLFEAGIVRRRVLEDEALRRAQQGDREARQQATCMQGAFFIGPADFYERLRKLSDEQRALIDMTSVAEVNRVYTDFQVEREQRKHARFLNVAMKATLLGSAVSDQLEGGAVVSGVGGQNEFVMMAHQLPDARSVLLFRATYEKGGVVRSNVHAEYPHTTIPRHMRDIFVTEYGVADLRGKSDEECVQAMLAISDSRFQEQLMQEAKRARKLSPDYRIPERQRGNLPSKLTAALRDAQEQGLLPRLPFGCDLREPELALAGRLKRLAAALGSWPGRRELLQGVGKQLLTSVPEQEQEALRFALQHLRLDKPVTAKEKLLAQLVRAAHTL